MSNHSTTRDSADRLHAVATLLVQEAMELAGTGKSAAARITSISHELWKNTEIVRSATNRLLSSLRAK